MLNFVNVDNQLLTTFFYDNLDHQVRKTLINCRNMPPRDDNQALPQHNLPHAPPCIPL